MPKNEYILEQVMFFNYMLVQTWFIWNEHISISYQHAHCVNF